MFLSLLKKAVPVPKITGYDNYLFVGPHPDDIEVACGGTVAKLTRQGKKVSFLIITNGCVGSVDPSLSEEQIVKIRKVEAEKSAELLGVTDVRFLQYDDGGVYDGESVKKDIMSVILELKPQAVFCPDYKVVSECHPDHLKAGKITTDAVFCAEWEKITKRYGLQGRAENIVLAYYYTGRPNAYVGVRKTRKLRLQAVACHKSQFTERDLQSLKSYFNIRELRFGFRSGKGRADGYRVLSPTHRHCFPEADEF